MVSPLLLLLLPALLALVGALECPTECWCAGAGAKCAGVAQLPRGLSARTVSLDVSGGALPVLRKDAFANLGLLNLQRLNLSSCQIRAVRMDAFRSLRLLESLDLSRNRLRFVNPRWFNAAPMMRFLRLDENPIVNLQNDAFLLLPQVETLLLNRCQIGFVAHRAFVSGSYSALRRLELADNQLQTLEPAALERLGSLERLELAGNPWRCDYELLPLRALLSARNVSMGAAPLCASPPCRPALPWMRLDEKAYRAASLAPPEVTEQCDELARNMS